MDPEKELKWQQVQHWNHWSISDSQLNKEFPLEIELYTRELVSILGERTVSGARVFLKFPRAGKLLCQKHRSEPASGSGTSLASLAGGTNAGCHAPPHKRNPKEAAVNVGQAQLKLVEEILKHNQLVQQRKNLHDVSPPPRAERRRPRRGPVPTPMGAAAIRASAQSLWLGYIWTRPNLMGRTVVDQPRLQESAHTHTN